MNIRLAALPAIIHHAFGLVVKGEPLCGRRIDRQIVMLADSNAKPAVRKKLLSALQDQVLGPETVIVLQQLRQNELGDPPERMTEFFCSCAEGSSLDLLNVTAALEGRKQQKQWAGEPNTIYRAQRLGGYLYKNEQFSSAQKGIALRIALADIDRPETFGNLLGIATVVMGNNNLITRGTMLQTATMGIVDPYERGRALVAALVDVDHAVNIYGLLRYATKDLQHDCRSFSSLVLLINTVAEQRSDDAKNIIRSFFCRQVEDYLDSVEVDEEGLTLAERWYYNFSKQCSQTQEQIADLFAYLH